MSTQTNEAEYQPLGAYLDARCTNFPAKVPQQLWAPLPFEEEALDSIEVAYFIANRYNILHPSAFRLTELGLLSVGLASLAISELAALRGAERGKVRLHPADIVSSFQSEKFFSVDGAPPVNSWDPLAGLYRCSQGWIRTHTNFPHHRAALLEAFGLQADCTREQLAKYTLEHSAKDLEQRAQAHGGAIVVACRSRYDWLKAQGATNAQLYNTDATTPSIFRITQTADAPRLQLLPLKGGAAPLSGLKVLDCSRIIAAPIGSRALAAYGAQVTRLQSPSLPVLEPLQLEFGLGKQDLLCDLKETDGKQIFSEQLEQSDVLVQAFRPGALQASAGRSLSETSNGIVEVALSAFRPDGKWAAYRGFDSIVQTCSGLNIEEGIRRGMVDPESQKLLPTPLPFQALDHATGYFAALAAVAGTVLRMKHGGCWKIEVSLEATADLLWSLGTRDTDVYQNKPNLVADSQSLVQAHAATLLQTKEQKGKRLSYIPIPGTLGNHSPAL